MNTWRDLTSCRQRMALWCINWISSIQLVALCNSRAMWEANENSDIDLFIIARSWQLWTARFLATAVTMLLGLRRWNTHGLIKGSPEYIKKTKEKFCLSFFITENAMNLDSIRIENDIYLDAWIKTLIPLVNKNNTLERFLAANGREKSSEKKETKKSWFLLSSFFFLLSFFESFIKRIWLKKTLKTYERLWKPWGVIISDTMLKFHDNDQRKIYRDKQKVS